jgi:hypothetical protein
MCEITKTGIYDRAISSKTEVSRYFVDILGLQSRLRETRDVSLRATLYKGIAALAGELVRDAGSVEAHELVVSAFDELGQAEKPCLYGAVRDYLISTNIGQIKPFNSKKSIRQARVFLGLPVERYFNQLPVAGE